MDKQGQVVFYTLMVGIVFVLLAIALAPVLKEFVDNARSDNFTTSPLAPNNSTGLDCNNDAISKYDKATCVVSDLTLFHFIIGLVVLGGAIITARRFLWTSEDNY